MKHKRPMMLRLRRWSSLCCWTVCSAGSCCSFQAAAEARVSYYHFDGTLMVTGRLDYSCVSAIARLTNSANRHFKTCVTAVVTRCAFASFLASPSSSRNPVGPLSSLETLQQYILLEGYRKLVGSGFCGAGGPGEVDNARWTNQRGLVL